MCKNSVNNHKYLWPKIEPHNLCWLINHQTLFSMRMQISTKHTHWFCMATCCRPWSIDSEKQTRTQLCCTTNQGKASIATACSNHTHTRKARLWPLWRCVHLIKKKIALSNNNDTIMPTDRSKKGNAPPWVKKQKTLYPCFLVPGPMASTGKLYTCADV